MLTGNQNDQMQSTVETPSMVIKENKKHEPTQIDAAEEVRKDGVNFKI